MNTGRIKVHIPRPELPCYDISLRWPISTWLARSLPTCSVCPWDTWLQSVRIGMQNARNRPFGGQFVVKTVQIGLLRPEKSEHIPLQHRNKRWCSMRAMWPIYHSRIRDPEDQDGSECQSGSLMACATSPAMRHGTAKTTNAVPSVVPAATRNPAAIGARAAPKRPMPMDQPTPVDRIGVG